MTTFAAIVIATATIVRAMFRTAAIGTLALSVIAENASYATVMNRVAS